MTVYLSLGLVTHDGRPLFASLDEAREWLPVTMRFLLDRADALGSATVYTFAVGDGFDEQGASEPCAIWAIGGITEAQATRIARALALNFEQRCVAVAVAPVSFVTPE